MALFIEIKSADGMVSRTRLDIGKNRFTVRLGDNYRIIDDQTGLTPKGIAVKRIDNNLVVDGFDAQDTHVEFAEFYSVCSAGSPCELTVDQSAGTGPVAITPGTQPIGALADGAFVLYDPAFAETAPAPPSLSDGTALRYSLYGLGALAVAGLAASGGGGGGDGGGGGGGGPTGALKLTSSEFVNSRTPTITGEGEPGSRVLVRIDTDGDGSPNVTYSTTVAPDFKWGVNLATAVPESGALPAGGLPDQSNVGITATTSAGNASLPTFVLTFDGTPPAPAVIDPVATDNVVNASEKTNGFVVSGSAEAGSIVTLSLGAQVLGSAAADANGRWQTPALPAASVPADGAYVLSAVVQDRAGNLSSATQSNLSINTAPPVMQALSIAGGDNQVSLTDQASVGFSGHTDPGAVVQVEWNNASKPVTADGGGNWSLAFAGAEVPASPGANFPYTITASNVVGNTAVSSGVVLVDVQAPTPPVINAVEGDNIVTLAERADGVTVTGQAEANTDVHVTWGAAVRPAHVDGSGNWSVQFASADLPTVPSPGGPTAITATLTDAVGNGSAPSQVAVNLEQPFNAPTIAAVEGDNVVNAAEGANGVVLTGTVQAGVTGVGVTWGSFNGAAAVAGTTWTLSVPAEQLPLDGASTVTATITGAGGGAAASQPVTIDRTAPPAPVVAAVAGDDVISFGEQILGVTITGSTDAGATVNVTLGAVSKAATVDAAGAWSSPFTAAEIPNGPTVVPLSVSATDSFANASSPTTRNITVEGILGPPPTAHSGDGSDVAIAMSDLLATSSATAAFQPQSAFPAAASVETVNPFDAGSASNYAGAPETLNSLLAEEVQSSGRLA